MSATGVDVFDKSLQATNTWLNDIMEEHGPDRQRAWHILGAVLRATRDRLPPDLAAHLSAQLPLLVRGAYYDQFDPSHMPEKFRSRDAFLHHVQDGLGGIRAVNPEEAARSVFAVLSHYLDPGQVRKVRQSLPEDIRVLWPDPDVRH